jgi:hypothetical protein
MHRSFHDCRCNFGQVYRRDRGSPQQGHAGDPTRSRKLTSVITGSTAASDAQLSENIYEWLFGLMEKQVP